MQVEFEKDTMHGEPLPKGLDVADSCLYIALKNLYAMYRKGLISRKDATEEKRKMICNWTNDKSKIEFLNRESDELRNKIGETAEKYKNDPCIENADELYAALYNLPNNWRTEIKEEK